jgi:hypothetical protein
MHERALDRNQGNTVDDRKWLPTALVEHLANPVADAPSDRSTMLERHMIDAITGALQHHAALNDPLADAGQRRVELAGMHQ